MKTRIFLLLLCLSLFPLLSEAQCGVGQTKVYVGIKPDNLGSQITWSLLPYAGGGAILSGGPYTNGNTNLVLDSVCVTDATNWRLRIHDSGGDGMCCLQGVGYYFIKIGNDTIWKNGSFAYDDSIYFQAPPSSLDASVMDINTSKYQGLGPIVVNCTLLNGGTTPISSIKCSYTVDGVTKTESRFGISVPKYSTYNFIFSVPWLPADTGSRVLHVNVVEVNGGFDLNDANDAMSKAIYVADHLAFRQVLIEEFTSTTDTLGFFSEQILDSLIEDNILTTGPIKYHIGFPSPGNDPMYLVDTVTMNTRKNYYGVTTSIPRAVLNGDAYIGVSYGIDQTRYNKELSEKGLFDITIDESKTGSTVFIKLITQNLVGFPGEDVRIFAAITESPLHFDIPPYIAGHQDFSHVLRKLLPTASGAVMNAAQAGLMDSVTFTFDIGTFMQPQNLHTIIFIQNKNTKEVYQVLRGDTITGFNQNSTINSIHNIPEFMSGVSVFPNPSAGQDVFVKLPGLKNEKIIAELFNLQGIRLMATDISDQIFIIHTQDLPLGLYLLRLTSGSNSISKKIIVIK